MPNIRIALIEPFYGGSHKRWTDELKRYSRHSIDIFSLPDRYWKWRMHGAAITLAKEYAARNKQYDLVLASDMLDLSLFLSLIPEANKPKKTAVYFHENQLCYPWSPRDKDVKRGRDLHYGFINYTSALVADHVFFNSCYHKDAFLSAINELLPRYPDFNNIETAQDIAGKSSALDLGMDLHTFDEHRPTELNDVKNTPVLIWNHRWEYDKNPIGFFKALYALADQGVSFKIALLGQRFEEEPPYFQEALKRLKRQIIHYGMVDSADEYARWLWKADILPVTSVQDFFGGSVIEAIYCGCHPLLPNRLAYPGHFESVENAEDYFYNTDQELVSKLADLIESGRWKQPSGLREHVAKYDWTSSIGKYDKEFGL